MKFETYKEQLYVVFRVVIGLLFLQHGLQKLFGMFGGAAVPPSESNWARRSD